VHSEVRLCFKYFALLELDSLFGEWWYRNYKACFTDVRSKPWSPVQWLKFVILATSEAEITRIMVQSQPEKKVLHTPAQHMAGCGGVHLSF
jgi:hypothetical protein